MITASIPETWKPTGSGDSKKLQGSCEITHLSLKAGNGAAVVYIYDCTDSNGANEDSLKWVLDAATTVPDNEDFSSPIAFKKGVFAVCDQGASPANPVLCYAARLYAV